MPAKRARTKDYKVKPKPSFWCHTYVSSTDGEIKCYCDQRQSLPNENDKGGQGPFTSLAKCSEFCNQLCGKEQTANATVQYDAPDPYSLDTASAWPMEQLGFFNSEPISGVKVVRFDTTGALQIAMASVSGRMPAFGICVDNVFSGDNTSTFYTQGMLFYGSGQSPFTNSDVGKTVFVGRSGSLATATGETFASGDVGQRIGVVTHSGMGVGISFAAGAINFSGGPSAATAFGQLGAGASFG